MVVRFPDKNPEPEHTEVQQQPLVDRIRRRVARPHPVAGALCRDIVASTRRIRVVAPPALLPGARLGAELIERIVALPARVWEKRHDAFIPPAERCELTLSLTRRSTRRLPHGWSAELPATDGSGLLQAALPLWRFASTLHQLRGFSSDPASLAHLPDFIEAVDEVPEALVHRLARELDGALYALADGPEHFAAQATVRLAHAGVPCVQLFGETRHPMARRSMGIFLVEPRRTPGTFSALRALRGQGVRTVLVHDVRDEEAALHADVSVPLRLGPGAHALIAADLLVGRVADAMDRRPPLRAV